jgi:hypothetical protein
MDNERDELFIMFNLSIPITISDLKRAKKKLLMLHPDKNIGVPNINNVYLKYLKAYKKLELVMEPIINTSKHTDIDNKFKQLSIDIKKQNKINDAFSTFVSENDLKGVEYAKEFNKMFETVYVKDTDDDGYDEWMKSDEDMYDKDNIEKSRNKLLQNTVCIVDQELYNSTIMYSDLKESYKNTILDVDEETFMNTKQTFKSENEYIQYRAQVMKGTDISQEESQIILDKQDDIDSYNMVQQAFKYKQQQDLYEDRMNKYTTNFLKLE